MCFTNYEEELGSVKEGDAAAFVRCTSLRTLRRSLAQLHQAHVTGKIMERRRQVEAHCPGYERAARRNTYGNMATARVWPRWQGRGRCICRYMRMDSDANSSTAVLQWEWHVSRPLLETLPCAIL